MKKITGTFIDEITFDIPPQNWGKKEWQREFEIFNEIGIDTAIIIRGGYKRHSVFPSKIVGDTHTTDLARLFLDAAHKNGVKLYFGIFDTGIFEQGKWDLWREEVAANQKFIAEVLSRYGDSPAFHGWYISHETSVFVPGIRDFYQHISNHMKDVTPEKPVLISPYYSSGVVHAENEMVRNMDEFADEWRNMLGKISSIDICAFQDGTCRLEQLPMYMETIKTVCTEAGIELWNNTETFSRDFPIKFPPTDYRRLLEKLRITSPFVEKQITFEFSHFMSPQSVWPAARNLFDRYAEALL
ncbi:MAG: DUF4434 domain-containing protein [Calditrichaeota bacterium]|nr:DUF4434 domain-containing protein [Calditrichota bacterium]